MEAHDRNPTVHRQRNRMTLKHWTFSICSMPPLICLAGSRKVHWRPDDNPKYMQTSMGPAAITRRIAFDPADHDDLRPRPSLPHQLSSLFQPLCRPSHRCVGTAFACCFSVDCTPCCIESCTVDAVSMMLISWFTSLNGHANHRSTPYLQHPIVCTEPCSTRQSEADMTGPTCGGHPRPSRTDHSTRQYFVPLTIIFMQTHPLQPLVQLAPGQPLVLLPNSLLKH